MAQKFHTTEPITLAFPASVAELVHARTHWHHFVAVTNPAASTVQLQIVDSAAVAVTVGSTTAVSELITWSGVVPQGFVLRVHCGAGVTKAVYWAAGTPPEVG